MVSTESSLRTIRLHGVLATKFGATFNYAARDAPHAIRAMSKLVAGFETFMLNAHKQGMTFSVIVGGRSYHKDELDMTKGDRDIHIMPVIIGSKKAGIFQTILGAVMVVAGALLWATPIGAPMVMSGVGMMLGGVSQMLAPQPPGLGMRESPENKPSYAFGSPVNTTVQGNPVPILYGSREIGGAIISAGVYTEDQYQTEQIEKQRKHNFSETVKGKPFDDGQAEKRRG
ncbi:putative tail component of prophage [Xenorhabdus mauleonii]|uniref:Phage-related protein, tail component n=1 Tax=Xenorhabdus mauleonii TaxID=351675 RepID=A0A1I3XV25_9GAMM|nr:putative tail component of prophage [Xenorhabdus mauleonii]SFK23129.1 Phage-related protein, tail component [Xenorhabdus mauleonii]